MDKERLLKAYLGSYAVRPSPAIRDMLEDVSPRHSAVIETAAFRDAITYLLLSEGRQNYSVMTSSEVIDVYVSKHETVDSFRELTVDVLIIVVHSHEMPNQRRWDLVFQLALERFSAGKKMIVIAPAIPGDYIRPFSEMGFSIIRAKNQISGTAQTITASQGDF